MLHMAVEHFIVLVRLLVAVIGKAAPPGTHPARPTQETRPPIEKDTYKNPTDIVPTLVSKLSEAP